MECLIGRGLPDLWPDSLASVTGIHKLGRAPTGAARQLVQVRFYVEKSRVYGFVERERNAFTCSDKRRLRATTVPLLHSASVSRNKASGWVEQARSQ